MTGYSDHDREMLETLDWLQQNPDRPAADWWLDRVRAVIEDRNRLVVRLAALEGGLTAARAERDDAQARLADVEKLHEPKAWNRVQAWSCDDPKLHGDQWWDDPWDTFCSACAETARYCAECTRVASHADPDTEAVNWPCPTVAAVGSVEGAGT